MTRIKYFYPIMLSAIGVGIHFLGTLKIFQLDVPRNVHKFMLCIDLLVVIGLLYRNIWGYRLGILLYFQQSIFQPYWGYQAWVTRHELFQLLVTSPSVIFALLILLFNKSLFVDERARPQWH